MLKSVRFVIKITTLSLAFYYYRLNLLKESKPQSKAPTLYFHQHFKAAPDTPHVPIHVLIRVTGIWIKQKPP